MSTNSNKAKRINYPSDLSKNGWQKLKKLFIIPASSPKGGRPAPELKEAINAIQKMWLADSCVVYKPSCGASKAMTRY
jgi:hypothetical protein